MVKAIILAAGKGKRMNSDLPKVLHQINGKALICYLLELVNQLNLEKKIIVIGYQGKKVKAALSDQSCHFVWQREQLGTGHAVMMAEKELVGYDGDILILYGDVPGLRVETIRKLINLHHEKGADVTILTAILPEGRGYGRILRDENGKVMGVKEAKDASPEELKIKEINSGIYVVKSSFLLSALRQLKNDNQQKEYYLTDIIGIAQHEGRKIQAVLVEDAEEIKGINTVEELAELEEKFSKRVFL